MGQQLDRSGLAATFPRFVAVGAVATGVQYLVLYVGVEWLGVQPVAASGLGYLLGTIANYFLNRRFTFNSSVPHAQSVLRFATVLAVGLMLNLLFMHLLTTRSSLPYMWSQVATTGVVLFWNYFGNSLWAFAKRSPRSV